MSWVNWGDFAAANEQEKLRRDDEQAQMAMSQQAAMDKALASLDSSALDQSRSGTFRGFDKLNGYSDLMAQRDAALQQSPLRQQAAPWESELSGPEQRSPWADLQKRLGRMNQNQSAINTRTQNQNAWDKQQADIKAYQAEQARKLDEAMNGKARKEAADYAAWSDKVQQTGGYYKGSPGAGAYYDAAQGTNTGRAPQPVRQSWASSPNVKDMQQKLHYANQNQIMPHDGSSSFNGGWSWS